MDGALKPAWKAECCGGGDAVVGLIAVTYPLAGFIGKGAHVAGQHIAAAGHQAADFEGGGLADGDGSGIDGSVGGRRLAAVYGIADFCARRRAAQGNRGAGFYPPRRHTGTDGASLNLIFPGAHRGIISTALYCTGLERGLLGHGDGLGIFHAVFDRIAAVQGVTVFIGSTQTNGVTIKQYA